MLNQYKHLFWLLIKLRGPLSSPTKATWPFFSNPAEWIKLGKVYEYFLGAFAAAEGTKGGQFYTPACIVTLMVEMLRPQAVIYQFYQTVHPMFQRILLYNQEEEKLTHLKTTLLNRQFLPLNIPASES